MSKAGKARLGTSWLWRSDGRGSFTYSKNGMQYCVERSGRRAVASVNGEDLGNHRSVQAAAKACVNHSREGAVGVIMVLLLALGTAGWAFSQGMI